MARKKPYLSQDIVHRLTGLHISSSQDSQKPQDLDLQEGVGDSTNIVFRAVPGGNKGFEVFD